MRNRQTLTLAFNLLGVALLACGEDAVIAGGPSPESACADAARAVCGKFDSCSTLLVQSIYGTTATCEARAQIDCLAGLNANGSSTTPTDAKACADAFAASTCDAAIGAKVEACWVRAGTLTDGTPCAVDNQCAGTNCRKSGGATCGACSTRAAAGGTCTSDSDCTQPLACTGGKCVARGEAGAACTAAAPCIGTLRCVGGVCGAGQTAGQACTPGEETCDVLAGLFCHPLQKVCVAVKVVDVGAPCGLVDGTFVGCKASGTCKGASATATGTCIAAAADGQPCEPDQDGPACLPPAKCLNNVCTLPGTACR